MTVGSKEIGLNRNRNISAMSGIGVDFASGLVFAEESRRDGADNWRSSLASFCPSADLVDDVAAHRALEMAAEAVDKGTYGVQQPQTTLAQTVL